MKYLILIILFFVISLFPQETGREINYQSIKQMIQSGDLDRALIDTEELLKENPGDATLALYQAEIWLNKGERLYQKKKYKSSFAEFEKAYKVWNNHPVVRQRYLELKDKNPLIDSTDDKSLTSIVPIGLQGTANQGSLDNGKNTSSEDFLNEAETWKSLDAKDRILYKHIIRLENLIMISLFILGLINISLLYIILKKRQ